MYLEELKYLSNAMFLHQWKKKDRINSLSAVQEGAGREGLGENSKTQKLRRFLATEMQWQGLDASHLNL